MGSTEQKELGLHQTDIVARSLMTYNCKQLTLKASMQCNGHVSILNSSLTPYKLHHQQQQPKQTSQHVSLSAVCLCHSKRLCLVSFFLHFNLGTTIVVVLILQ